MLHDAGDSICLKLKFISPDLELMKDSVNVLITTSMWNDPVNMSDMFIDPNGDIIASYIEDSNLLSCRIGFDGQLKSHRQIEGITTENHTLQVRYSFVYSESPLLYLYLFGRRDRTWLTGYIVDADFNLVGEHKYSDTGLGYLMSYNSGLQEHVVTMDDSSYLLASRIDELKINGQQFMHAGLAKFDREHNLESIQMFNERTLSIGPISTIVAAPDTIYYSYMTDIMYNNQLVLACLDADLNVRWKRYLLAADWFHWGSCMCLLSDGSVAVGSYNDYYTGLYSNNIDIIIVKDNYWDVDEHQDIVRPYMFYPNPVSDNLNFQYSPDVQPSQIELYDLQGRMVLTQSGSLEQLNLQGISAGEYLMNVTLENGKTFTDKVVKQ